MQELLLGQCCVALLAIVAVSCMQATVCDINYIAESDASWKKESGSVTKLWASNIRFGYCTILTDVKIRACLANGPMTY